MDTHPVIKTPNEGLGRNRFYRLLGTFLVFIFVGFGLLLLSWLMLAMIAWGLIHSTSRPVMYGVFALFLTLPLGGGILAARAYYRWMTTVGPIPSIFDRKPTSRGIVWGMVLVAFLGYIGGIRHHLSLPKVPRLQMDLVVVKGQTIPSNPVIAEDTLYWINNPQKRSPSSGIMAVSAYGGKPRLICAVNGFTRNLFNDGRTLYWCEGFHLVKYSLPNGPRQELAPVSGIDAMVFDRENLYWINGMNNFNTKPNLFKMPKSGNRPSGVLAGLVSETPHGLTQDFDFLYWTDAQSKSIYKARKSSEFREAATAPKKPLPIDIANEDLRQATGLDSEVFQGTSLDPNMRNMADPATELTETSGNNDRVTVATGQNSPHSIVVDGEHLFWTCFGTVDLQKGKVNKDGTLVRASKTGQDITILASDLDEPTALAADDKNVYVVCKDRIMRVSKTGGDVSVLVDKQLNIAGLRLDETRVYWSDERGAIYRIAK